MAHRVCTKVKAWFEHTRHGNATAGGRVAMALVSAGNAQLKAKLNSYMYHHGRILEGKGWLRQRDHRTTRLGIAVGGAAREPWKRRSARR